jgi:Na+/melibiose symporter-like transporter
MFAIAAVMWMAGGLLFLFADPGWSTSAVVALACVSALGYCAVDLMPWAMLGEVIDADEDVTGERRDGLYNGFFTFFRKLAGALGVFLVLSVLDVLGFQRGETQTETVRQAIRWMTFLAPGFFLAIGAVAAVGYPLSRARHDDIAARLEARRNLDAARTKAAANRDAASDAT